MRIVKSVLRLMCEYNLQQLYNIIVDTRYNNTKIK